MPRFRSLEQSAKRPWSQGVLELRCMIYNMLWLQPLVR